MRLLDWGFWYSLLRMELFVAVFYDISYRRLEGGLFVKLFFCIFAFRPTASRNFRSEQVF